MTTMMVRRRDGSIEPIQEDKINTVIQQACEGLEGVSWSDVALGCQVSWYNGISTEEIDESAIMSARTLIEKHPNYTYVAARLVLKVLYQQVFGPKDARRETAAQLYPEHFAHYLQTGVEEGLLDERLLEYDLDRLAQAIDPDADLHFQFQGITVLKDRYLIRNRKRQIIELPQWIWMRVAMGLALLEEGDREARAIEFYTLIKDFDYMPSTPTLFSSGTQHPQLSSCYLNTVEDSIEGIFKVYTDNARLSKWAGGLGTDWTPVRSIGASIRGTNGESQGVIPWLKIDNDVAIAVNQGGKRKGSHCAYLETWHLDMEDFLELRKNVGDERRRTHDINTANWIPDLFMKRVLDNGQWTLFSPDQTPELHDLYGREFQIAYEKREAEFDAGEIRGKRLEAKDLWRKMLTMLYETGHPWITFKDPCNLRSPQDHVGVVHSSNLCTEITLNTSKDETAVCNLGSVNLSRHMTFDSDTQKVVVDYEKLERTITTAVRMLDNVIDINFYPTDEAERANKTHRAIGLGTMGYQALLYGLGLPFASEDHLELADTLYEHISYYAIAASTNLAAERGSYNSFQGSKWSRGLMPVDTIDLLEQERGLPIEINRTTRLDWETLRQTIKTQGMRNSNIMAIAPTATISNIVGTTPCIEPSFKNLYVTSNLSGEFTVINEWLVRDLEERGMWNEDMADMLKAVDGNLTRLPEMPKDLQEKYADIFDLDMIWLVKAAAHRGKWLDQAQSLNLFVSNVSGKYLHELYTTAWRMGLKTTYYLRTLGASQVEKSTVDQGKFGKTHKRSKDSSEPTPIRGNQDDAIVSGQPQNVVNNVCSLLDPECESCQ